jgi:hypothetical protein
VMALLSLTPTPSPTSTVSPTVTPQPPTATTSPTPTSTVCGGRGCISGDLTHDSTARAFQSDPGGQIGAWWSGFAGALGSLLVRA